MEDNKIKFITNESDDWSILQCGDFKTCNHQISKEEWAVSYTHLQLKTKNLILSLTYW